MPVVSKQQLENAALDATTLQTVVNGSASPGTVTSRLGTPLLTLAKIIDDLAGQDIGEGAAALINGRIDDLGIALLTVVQLSEIQSIAKSTNAITLSESEFEDLPFYDLDSYYHVTGIGIYKGRDFLVSEPIPQTADNIYVSNTGNNSNPGTDPNAPKQTILNAFGTIGSGGGKTIWLEAGTYAENLTFTNKVFTEPVVIRAMPGHQVTLKSASGSSCFFLSGNCENIKIRNVRFETISSQLQLVNTTSRSLNCGVYDCLLVDNTTPFKVASVSLTGTGGGATNSFDLKRCTFIGGSNFAINCTAVNNVRIVGNDLTQCSNNSGNITITPDAVGANCRVNQNAISGGIALVGGTGVSLVAEVLENDCRYIQHTGGTGTYLSTLSIENNSVNGSTFGIHIAGYTVGGYCNSNNIVALGDYAIAWPPSTGTNECDSPDISGNNITNNGANGNAILIGPGATDATITKNIINSAGGGRYALSLTGSGHTVSQNTIFGGSLGALLLKGCISCSITANTIDDGIAGSTAIEFALNNLTAPANNVVTGNTVIVNNGQLYNQLLANIGTGNTVNNNTYQIIGAGVWGSLLGAFVNSIADVRARWTSQYDITTNDSTSTSI
jgi:hypothetical protein